MNLLFSTLGRKIQVAISGICLTIFLFFHLANNLVLFSGAQNFNEMVYFLESIKPLIRIMEFSLLFILILHTANAIYLTIQNKKKKFKNYEHNAANEVSTLNSRTMAISGTIILIFLLIHLFYIWGTFQAHSFYENETYYDVLLRKDFGYLNNKITAIFYFIAILFIGYHLKHGFQSSLKTFGILNSDSRILSAVGFLFWGLVPLGFVMIIISIHLGIIH